MFSRENRVILAGFLAAAVVLAAVVIVETGFGISVGRLSLLVFVVVGILGLAAPQCYLMRTDSSVSRSSRVRATLVGLVLLAWLFSPSANTWEATTIRAITVIAGLLAIAYEFRSGSLAGTESADGSTS